MLKGAKRTTGEAPLRRSFVCARLGRVDEIGQHRRPKCTQIRAELSPEKASVLGLWMVGQARLTGQAEWAI